MRIGTTGLLLAAVTLSCCAGAARAQERARGPRQLLQEERIELVGAVPGIEAYHLVLITVDGLEPAALGCYGNPRPGVTPSIDELATTGFRFDAAYAASTDRADRADSRSNGMGAHFSRQPIYRPQRRLYHQ